jgi:hypothetical protein
MPGRTAFNGTWLNEPSGVKYTRADASTVLSGLLQDDSVAIKREDVEQITACFNEMLEAIRTGSIDSPWLSGEPEVGIPAHKWHEEWEYYARDQLEILTATMKGKQK